MANARLADALHRNTHRVEPQFIIPIPGSFIEEVELPMETSMTAYQAHDETHSPIPIEDIEEQSEIDNSQTTTESDSEVPMDTDERRSQSYQDINQREKV
jgi:DNA polymerase I-like protein with 3'-5' exonuclease and polymerase domains